MALPLYLILRPNGNNNTNWNLNDYTLIDDIVTQPVAPTTGSDYAYPNKNDDSESQEWTLEDCPTHISSVTSVIVWVYGKSTEADPTMDVNINVNSSWQTAQTITFTSSYAWYSKTFTGTWTEANMNGMLVRLTTKSIVNNLTWEIDALYCYVTGSWTNVQPTFT